MDSDKDQYQNLNISTNILLSLGGQFGYQLINIFTIIILMRLIDPVDFGSFYFTYAFFGILYLFKDFGFGQAIIQKKFRDEKLNTSVFWMSIIISIFLSIIVIFFSEYFKIQDLYQSIIYLLVFDLLILTLGNIPITLLNHDLKFASLQKIRIFSSLTSSLISLTLAFNGFGVISIASKVISFNLICTSLAFYYTRWVPKIYFHLQSVKNEFNYSIPLFANNILNYLVRNVDDILIGHVIGKQSLGFYNRSYYILLLPITNITSIIGGVLFPSLSKIKEDVDQVKLTFFKSMRLIVFFISPLMLMIIFNTEQIINLLFGEKWLPMKRTLQILSFLSIFQSYGSLFGVLFLIYGKTKLLWKLNFYTSIFLIAGILIGVYYFGSIEKTALCYTLISIIAFLPSMIFTSRIIDSTLNDFLQPLISPIIIALLSNIISSLIINSLDINYQIVNLTASIIISIIIYVVGISILKPGYISDIKSIFNRHR